MKCPNCGVALMGGMTVCPKCKYDTRTVDGGELFLKRVQEEKASFIPPEQRLEEIQKKLKPILPGAVFHVDGVRGRSIDIFPHKCVISVDSTLGALLSGNATDGEKTIYYGDCVGLQFKAAGMTLGYLQFETASATMNNSQSNFFNENTFTYDVSTCSNSDMLVVLYYVKNQLEKIKVRQYGNGLD